MQRLFAANMPTSAADHAEAHFSCASSCAAAMMIIFLDAILMASIFVALVSLIIAVVGIIIVRKACRGQKDIALTRA